jgi:DNA gyrase/topoisomerase IV subunit B
LFKEYIRNLSALYPKIRFTFNGEKITCSKKEIYDAVLDDHVVYKSNKGEFAFGFSKTDKRDVIFVNSKQVSSFEKFDLFKSQIFTFVKNALNKKHDLSVYLNTWFNENVSAVVFLRGTNVRFRNQTKDVLVSYDSTEKEFLSEHPAKVATAFLKDKALVERFLDFYSKKNHDEAKTKLKKAKNEFVEKLTEATGPIDKKILLICEGDSAKSVFNPVRDKNVHSILPMKGKPSNVFKLSLTEVVKNREFFNIISSIHLGDRSHLRHSKAYIVSDADSDGLHIRILLIQFFVKFFPWFVEEGRLFVMEAPRYKYKLDGKVVYSTEEEPPDEAKNVEYYKGLGSMDKESVRHMLDNPKLIKIEDVKDLNSTYNVLYGNKELEEE